MKHDDEVILFMKKSKYIKLKFLAANYKATFTDSFIFIWYKMLLLASAAVPETFENKAKSQNPQKLKF
jgi:hypothetical protein